MSGDGSAAEPDTAGEDPFFPDDDWFDDEDFFPDEGDGQTASVLRAPTGATCPSSPACC